MTDYERYLAMSEENKQLREEIANWKAAHDQLVKDGMKEGKEKAYYLEMCMKWKHKAEELKSENQDLKDKILHMGNELATLAFEHAALETRMEALRTDQEAKQ